MRTAGGPDLPLVAPSFRAVFLETLARAHLELGDRDAAERAAAEAKPVATKTGLDMQHGCADRALAAVALHDNDAERAAELAIAAAARMEQAGAMFEVARSLTLAGRALGRGDRERARGVLEQAALLATERGAERVRQAAERELRQLGHRIHRRTTPGASDGEGVATLTRRELEIARRIVDRRTNRQIAEELYLSPKTVETHIRNIFAKLGVDSRIEVARIVERTDRLAAAS